MRSFNKPIDRRQDYSTINDFGTALKKSNSFEQSSYQTVTCLLCGNLKATAHLDHRGVCKRCRSNKNEEPSKMLQVDSKVMELRLKKDLSEVWNQ